MLIWQESFTTVENLGGKNALWGQTRYFQHLRSHSAFQRFHPVTGCAGLGLVAQSCPTLCDPMDCSPLSMGILQARILEWVACPPPGDLSNPGIKARSPPLQADSLPSQQPPGKPMNTRMGSLSVLRGIFPTQESNWGLPHCTWVLYQLSFSNAKLHFTCFSKCCDKNNWNVNFVTNWYIKFKN